MLPGPYGMVPVSGSLSGPPMAVPVAPPIEGPVVGTARSVVLPSTSAPIVTSGGFAANFGVFDQNQMQYYRAPAVYESFYEPPRVVEHPPGYSEGSVDAGASSGVDITPALQNIVNLAPALEVAAPGAEFPGVQYFNGNAAFAPEAKPSFMPESVAGFENGVSERPVSREELIAAGRLQSPEGSPGPTSRAVAMPSAERLKSTIAAGGAFKPMGLPVAAGGAPFAPPVSMQAPGVTQPAPMSAPTLSQMPGATMPAPMTAPMAVPMTAPMPPGAYLPGSMGMLPPGMAPMAPAMAPPFLTNRPSMPPTMSGGAPATASQTTPATAPMPAGPYGFPGMQPGSMTVAPGSLGDPLLVTMQPIVTKVPVAMGSGPAAMGPPSVSSGPMTMAPPGMPSGPSFTMPPPGMASGPLTTAPQGGFPMPMVPPGMMMKGPRPMAAAPPGMPGRPAGPATTPAPTGPMTMPAMMNGFAPGPIAVRPPIRLPSTVAPAMQGVRPPMATVPPTMAPGMMVAQGSMSVKPGMMGLPPTMPGPQGAMPGPPGMMPGPPGMMPGPPGMMRGPPFF
mmetsp:Transcript_6670/g.11436  ORF Transcript_6670/g.11436 Transcript_6670/m.11436 type:complete len:561 (+) Transcript_6670:84-1766(+)